VKRAVEHRIKDGKHTHLDALLGVLTLSSAIGADGVQVMALPARSGLADKIKMLILAQQRNNSNVEGRVALEQNESV
jgi:hypothetical protein